MKNNVVSIDAGDHRARVLERRDRLVCEFLPLVREIAARLRSTLPDAFHLDDLIGAGQLGLLHAATIFRESEGVPFVAFARVHIRWAIRGATRRKYYDQAKRTVSIERTFDEYLQSNNEGEYKEPGGEMPEFEAAIDMDRLLARVGEVIRKMPARQQQLLCLRYSGFGMSVAECARAMGLATASAQNLHGDCIKYLRAQFPQAS